MESASLLYTASSAWLESPEGTLTHLVSYQTRLLTGASAGASAGALVETPVCGVGSLTVWWLDSKSQHPKGEREPLGSCITFYNRPLELT